jgi:hypothetical protein
MEAEAVLYGGGLSTQILTDPKRAITSVVLKHLIANARDAAGRKEITFSTDEPMTFIDFDGTFVAMERAKAQYPSGDRGWLSGGSSCT